MHKISLKTKILSRKRLYILMLFAVLCTCIALFFFFKSLVKPSSGLVSYYPNVALSDNRIVFQPREQISPAIKAGLLAGDVLVMIDNQEIATVRDIVNRDYDSFSFSDINITIERSGKLMTFVVHPEHMVSRYDWFFFLVFLVILGVTSFFLIFNFYTEKSHLIIAFLCQFFLMYICALSFGFQDMFSCFIVNIGEVSALLFIPFFLFFDPSRKKHALWKAMYIVVFVFTIVLFSIRYGIFALWNYQGDNAYFTSLVWLNQVQGVIDICAYTLVILLLIVNFIKTAQPHIKKHIEWIIAGTLLSFPPHFIFNQLPYLFPAFAADQLSIGNTSYLFLSFLPLFYIVGLVKSRGNRLFVFTTRTVFYILIIIISLAFYSVMFFPFQDFFLHILNIPAESAGFIIALLLFLATLYVQFMLFMIAERYLIRQRFQSGTQLVKSLSGADNHETGIAESPSDLALFVSALASRMEQYISTVNKSFYSAQKIYRLLEADNADEAVEITLSTKALQKSRDAWNQVQASVGQLGKIFSLLQPVKEKKVLACIPVDAKLVVHNAIREICAQFPEMVIVEPEYQQRLRMFCCPEDIIYCCCVVFQNAIESSINQSAPINVRLSSNEKRVRIHISDSGAGIAERNKNLVGQPFFSTKNGHEGLGLFTAKIILNRNNGELYFENNDDIGATVTLDLGKGK
ncbi:MAG: PDZ domain-containing protein [Spirochaetales bacterium]|nr:PDZ domain-containing protein [Spirochaetales bacterium]